MESSTRRAARVLLVDEADRLLMFHGFDPTRPERRYWMTVGGGVDAGESVPDGAVRELAEETGLRLDPSRLGPPVRHEVIEYLFDGAWYRQEQDYFLVRVPAFEVSTAGFDEHERAYLDGHRWWTLAELCATDEPVYPEDIADLLAGLLEEASC